MTEQEQIDILRAFNSVQTTDKVQPNFKDVKTVADEIAKVVVVANALLDSVFTTVNDNIDDIKTNATQSANISILANMTTTLESLATDKPTLDSLKNDKPTLDGLYALKDKIDSLYADRDKHTSLVNDKSKLDTLHTNLSKLTSIFDKLGTLQAIEPKLPVLESVNTNFGVYDSVNSIKAQITALELIKDELVNLHTNRAAYLNVNSNEANINEVSTLSPKISTVVANILDIQNAEENAQLVVDTKDEVLALRDEAEQFRNEAQTIAGGNITASNVKFTDLTDLQTWKTNTDQAITAVNNVLANPNTALDTIVEISNFIEAHRADFDSMGIDNVAGLRANLDAKAAEIIALQNNLSTLQTVVTNLNLSQVAETATYKRFTATLLSKLNSIATGANKYTHPATHSISEISGLDTALAGKSSTEHNHDSEYLKKSGAQQVAGSITVTDYVAIGQHLHVGQARDSSWIHMYDGNEGNRAIHCNSDRVGFLKQTGTWGAYCEDNGDWKSENFLYGLTSRFAALIDSHNLNENGHITFRISPTQQFLFQFGKIYIPGNAEVLVTLPVAYPNINLGAYSVQRAAAGYGCSITNTTTTTITIRNNHGAGMDVSWHSMGA